MIQLMMTYSNPETVVILPNPDFDNTDALTSTVNIMQTYDGSIYVYKKTRDYEKLQWTFSLTPNKTEELKAAIDHYIGNYIKIIGMQGEVWQVLLSNDTFTFTTKTRDNWTEVQLEFEGVRVNG